VRAEFDISASITAVGAALARRWNFPAEIIDALAWHHGPALGAPGGLAGIIHYADAIAHALDLDERRGTGQMPSLDAQRRCPGPWLGSLNGVLAETRARFDSYRNPAGIDHDGPDQRVSLPGTLFPLADSLSSGLLLHRGGKVLYANKAMSRLSGFTPEELAKRTSGPSTRQRRQHHPRARSGPAGQANMRSAATKRCCSPAAGESAGWSWWSPMRKSRAKRTIVCNFIDVTERKRAEAAQKQAQQLLTQIIDADPVPTLVINARHVPSPTGTVPANR
jgi:PAS domain S-box-containing protein